MPVLRRPHKVAPLLASIAGATPEPHRTLFVCSPGDTAEIEVVDAAGAERLVIDEAPVDGDYARKINAAYRASTEPFLFTGADDLHFHPGWLSAAMARLEPGIGVVGTNDLGNERVIRGEHATHFLVTREYVDRFGTIDEPGKIFHEGYAHEFVDDELIGTARKRAAWAHAGDSVVEHMHPHWGKGEMDALYADEPRRMIAGRAVHQQRRALWT